MSYRRSDAILTNDLVEYCTYVVRAFEAEKYRQAGINDLLIIPDDAKISCGEEVHDFMTTLWWIIENTPEGVIAVLDDDISTFIYRLDDAIPIKSDIKNHKEIVTSELERIGQILLDLNLGLACDNPNGNLFNYTQEFTFKGMIGAMKIFNKNALKAKYDPEDPAMSDIDIVMQELYQNRIILQPRYIQARAAIDKNKGSTQTSSADNYEFLCAMKTKWGKYYDYNFKKNQASINVKR